MGRIHKLMVQLAEGLKDRPSLCRRCTVPDYPFVGPNIGGEPTVSFVGKANFWWPPPKHPEFLGHEVGWSQAPLRAYFDRGHSVDEILAASRKVGEEFRLERVADFYAGRRKGQKSSESKPGFESGWWKFVVEFAIGLISGDPQLPRYYGRADDVDRALRSVHTTNLFKVAQVEDNPGGELAETQIELGASQLLRAELEAVQPKVVLFPIWKEYRPLRSRLLPGWEEVKEHEVRDGPFWEVTWDGFDGTAIVTRHPQSNRATRAYLRDVYQWVQAGL